MFLLISLLCQAQDTIQVKQKKTPKFFISLSYGGPVLPERVIEYELQNFIGVNGVNTKNTGVFTTNLSYHLSKKIKLGIYATGAFTKVTFNYLVISFIYGYSFFTTKYETAEIKNSRVRIIPRIDYTASIGKSSRFNYFISAGAGVAIFNTVINSNYGKFNLISGRYLHGVYPAFLLRTGISYKLNKNCGVTAETGTAGPIISSGIYATF